MRYLANANEMQKIDSFTINEIGIPELVLMERAAFAVTDEIEKYIRKKLKKGTDAEILIVVEKGNNGGDGLAVARQLMSYGYRPDVFCIDKVSRATDSFTRQKEILSNLGAEVLTEFPEKDYDVVVDAIFGTGLKRDIEGGHKKVIEKINDMDSYVIAVDIPSGVNAGTGEIMGVSINADLTVTFGLQKMGQVLYPGCDACGKCVIYDIGFPEQAVNEISPETFTFEKSDLKLLPERKPDSNKGTYGKIAIIAGSKEISGAACLAALAAYEAGAGMVKVYTHKENRTILGSFLPEALIMTYENKSEALLCMDNAVSWGDVILIGPGMGTDEIAVEMVGAVLRDTDKPVVLDADGLNIIAENKNILKNRKCKNMVITPHIKEMSRLTGKTIKEIKAEPLKCAMEFAEEYGLVCVLKDARTFVCAAGEKTYVNMSGNDGMASAGSGDVLSGIIAALIGMGKEKADAARLGVYVHGLAGDMAAKEYGRYGMTARDIAWKTADIMKSREKR